MEDIGIKFEAQLVSASMTNAGGHKITLRISPEDLLDNPHNSTSKAIETSRVRSLMLQQPNTRFICVLVQLEAESDEPVEPEDVKQAKKMVSVLSMICRSDGSNFFRWLRGKFPNDEYISQLGYGDLEDSEKALLTVKHVVGFGSRKELKENAEAVMHLRKLIESYRNE